jgi:hypothetical protein
VAGGMFVYQGLVEPLAKTKAAIATLEEEIENRDIELFQRLKDHRELVRLKALSLPTDPDPRHLAFDGAWTGYDKYLRDLMKQSRVKTFQITGAPPAPRAQVNPRDRNKKPLVQTLTYTIKATGELQSMVALLDSFYQTPLLHQVKAVTIKPVKTNQRQPSRTQDVDLNLTVETLLVDGAEKRYALMPGEGLAATLSVTAALARSTGGIPIAFLPTGAAMFRPLPMAGFSGPGRYAYIVRRNVFYRTLPPPPVVEKKLDVNVNEHVRLTSIVKTGNRWEAFFYNVFDNINTRVRAQDDRVFWARRQRMDRIYENISVWDDEGKKKTARVIRVDHTDVYFYFDDSYYGIHYGESLADAFNNKALSDERIKELGLPPDPDKVK